MRVESCHSSTVNVVRRSYIKSQLAMYNVASIATAIGLTGQTVKHEHLPGNSLDSYARVCFEQSRMCSVPP